MPGKTEREISPGDFPIGSLESRAAARAELERRSSQSVQFIVRIERIGTDEEVETFITTEKGLVAAEKGPNGEWRARRLDEKCSASKTSLAACR
jgi:hypothetical protein